MSDRTFAKWVKPIARSLAESRAEVAAFARSLPAEAWSEPSALEGWTRKDVLAHLAGDTGKVSAAAMRSAVEPDTPAPTFGASEHELNARDVEARRSTPVEELIAEIETDCETWLELMSRFDDDTDCRWDGFPISLREYLNLLVPHDRDHLAEMRVGLEVAT